MKKIFYILASAIVALGAMACQNEVDENITPENTNDVVSFTVAFDEATRISMTPAGNTANFAFEGNETLCLEYNENPFYFTNKTAESPYTTFTGEGKGLSEIVKNNNLVTITNEYDLTSASKAYTKFGEAAYFYFNGRINDGVTLSLSNYVIHCTTGADDVILYCDYYQAGDGDAPESLTLSANGEYWINLDTAVASEINVSYKIKGETEAVKSATLNAMVKDAYGNDAYGFKIFNLGKLTKINKVYLAPGVWNVDGAWFAAHFFNAKDDFADVKMTDKDADGIYECNVPVGMESVIFCRMNPAYNEFSWDDGHVWNKTADLVNFTVDDTYYKVGWDEKGAWSAEYNAKKDAYNKKLYLKPNSNWKEANARFAAYFFGNGETWVSMTKVANTDYYVVDVPQGYPSVIFCRMNPSAADNKWDNKWTQTGDLTIPSNMNRAYTINDGSWDQGSWSDIFESTIFNL